MMIHFGERVGLLGQNGSGKTTFLKMLLGEEQPDEGMVRVGCQCKGSLFSADHDFTNEELTVLECFREDISILEGKAREYLSKFMFYKNSVFKKVKHLSGGERIRLKLAMLLFHDINLLILDEPTNHLDIDSIETLEEALEDFNGTIFFISHDRYFINRIAQRTVAIEDCILKSYTGNYDDYKREIEKRTVEAKEKPDGEKVKKSIDRSGSMKSEIPQADMLKKIENLESEIREIDLAMADSQIEYDALNKLYERKLDFVKELDVAMELWLSLQRKEGPNY